MVNRAQVRYPLSQIPSSLSGRRPLHLANARSFGRSKAPLGLLLLRKRGLSEKYRTARKASGHLSGQRPLHLANARPFGRLKAPLGLSLLRCAAQTRACLWQAEQAHHAPSKEKQSVPVGERPVVHITIVCGFWQGASGWARPVFHDASSFSARSIRYPTPTWV